MPKSSIERRMPRRLSACELGDRLLGFAHDAALGELELQVARVEAGPLQRLRDAVHEIRLLELAAGQIDRRA